METHLLIAQFSEGRSTRSITRTSSGAFCGSSFKPHFSSSRVNTNGTAITNFQDLFSAGPNTNASRILFGRDGMIYMTSGVADPPQAARAYLRSQFWL